MSFEPILNDKLATLDAALDPEVARAALEPVVRATRGPAVELRSVGVEVIQRRAKRCVVRYRLDLGEPREGVNLIGKVFCARRGESVFENMRELWSRGFRREHGFGTVSMPEPLAFLPELRLLVQEEVPGPAITAALRADSSPRYMRQLADVLVRLHGCGFVPGPPFRMRNHLMRCHPKYQTLALACPELESDIEHVVRVALEREAQIDESVFTSIHGDFHMGQVLVDGDRCFLIDFDALSYGDPAADLGNVLVFLKGKAKKLDNVPELVDTLLESYFREMDSSIEKRIPLYEAMTHLRRACKRLRFQRPKWRHKVAKMIRAAVACLDRL